MILRPPRSTRTDTLFPYTTLFRSVDTKLSLLLALRAGEGCNALIAFMQGVSWLGGGIPRWLLALLLAALLWHSAGRRSALLLAGTAAAANLASTLLQNIFDRPRPDLIPPQIGRASCRERVCQYG